MIDGWSVLGAIGGVLGASGAFVTAVHTVKAASARRSVERARDAVVLLQSLDALPDEKAAGTRLVLRERSEQGVREELHRIVRENAAAYALHNPTPTGFETGRLLTAVYCVVFLAFGVVALVESSFSTDESVRLSLFLVGIVALVVTLMLLALALVLWDRMIGRNRSRELAGTPGREKYFSAVSDVIQTARELARARRHRREKQRELMPAPPQRDSADLPPDAAP